MTELEVAEERERNAWSQQRHNEWSADRRPKAREKERREEEEILEANWVANMQLQSSQLRYDDSEALSSPRLSPQETEPGVGSQAHILEISSNNEISKTSDDDGEPR